jgi:hypothetical protein
MLPIFAYNPLTSQSEDSDLRCCKCLNNVEKRTKIGPQIRKANVHREIYEM